MFYSHDYLSQKGPLGTVWCAAHLQHRLKKWQYTKTDISITVERIMFPEVPIALIMSGHLLLGVVRIYSKKVDYLHQDCNIVLVWSKNAFSTEDLTLPANANQASCHFVTLPERSTERFELDAMELDFDLDRDWSQDNHLTNQEDITLPDRTPNGFFRIISEEDLSHQGNNPSVSVPHLMDEDYPLIQVDATPNLEDPDPGDHQTGGFNERPNEEQNTPEVRRDGFPLENIDDTLEPDGDLVLQILKDKTNILTPSAAVEELLDPVAQSVPSQHLHELPFTVLDHDLVVPNDAENGTPNFRVGPSPVAEQQQQPEGRRRKRKQLYDERTVLTNKFLKTSLAKTSNILREKMNCPFSALGVWELNNRLKKDKVFFDPIITGLSADLCCIFIEPSRSYLSSAEPVIQPEPNVPSTAAPVDNFDEEIEHFRDYQDPSGLPDIFQSTNWLTPSTNERSDYFTPGPGTDLGSGQVPTTSGTGVAPTSDLGTNAGLSDIPEIADSADGGVINNSNSL